MRLFGERIISPSEAAWKHVSNREQIRHLNILYSIMRGREYEEIEKNPKTEPNWMSIDRLKKEYGLNIVEIETEIETL